MRGTSRKYEVCFENLEEALAESPETYGHFDLLCAGWPCQDNSQAGKRKGMQGEKSSLWREVKRCLELFRPKWFVGENVPGLFSVNAGRDFWEIISDLNSLGYCVAWDVLDSQNFGVAQRRKRVFVVGSFGNISAGKVLFEQKSGCRDVKTVGEIRKGRICISGTIKSRDGKANNATETYVASTIGTNANPDPHYGMHFIAQTLGATPRDNTSFVWQDTHIAEINADGKRKIAGATEKLDSMRGIVIGNAVSVPVAKWIGKRIKDYEERFNVKI